MTRLRAGGIGFNILAALANNGPATRERLKEIYSGLESTSGTLNNTLVRLRERGLMVTKTILTPAGLAELQRLGWKPDLRVDE